MNYGVASNISSFTTSWLTVPPSIGMHIISSLTSASLATTKNHLFLLDIAFNYLCCGAVAKGKVVRVMDSSSATAPFRPRDTNDNWASCQTVIFEANFIGCRRFVALNITLETEWNGLVYRAVWSLHLENVLSQDSNFIEYT